MAVVVDGVVGAAGEVVSLETDIAVNNIVLLPGRFSLHFNSLGTNDM